MRARYSSSRGSLEYIKLSTNYLLLLLNPAAISSSKGGPHPSMGGCGGKRTSQLLKLLPSGAVDFLSSPITAILQTFHSLIEGADMFSAEKLLF